MDDSEYKYDKYCPLSEVYLIYMTFQGLGAIITRTHR